LFSQAEWPARGLIDADASLTDDRLQTGGAFCGDEPTSRPDSNGDTSALSDILFSG
jgi:hypothetical protein